MREVFTEEQIESLANEYGLLMFLQKRDSRWYLTNSFGEELQNFDSMTLIDAMKDLHQRGGYLITNFFNRGQKSGQWNPTAGDQIYILERPWREKNEDGEWELTDHEGS